MVTKKITAVELAKLAGVSHATVSRAFNPNGTVSRKTRQRILELAKEHGYQPNRIAASLNRSKSGLVAIVAANVDFYESEQLGYLTQEIQSIRMMPLVLNCGRHNDSKELLQFASSYQVDYAIIYADLVSNEDVRKIFGASRLILVRNRTEFEEGQTTVIIDPKDAIEEAVEHLVGQGRRHFIFLNGKLTIEMNARRKACFSDALARHGLSLVHEGFGDGRYNSAYRETQDVLKRYPEADAIIAHNDAMAFGVCDALRALGKEIPQDVAVVGHDGLEPAYWDAYDISTIALNHQAYARAIVSRIKQYESGSGEESEPIVFKPVYRKGSTT